MKIRYLMKLCVLAFACALGITPGAAQTTGSLAPVTGGGAVKASDAAAGRPNANLSKSLEFKSVAAAVGHCKDGTVVWSTLSKGHSFHLSSSRYYGKTKHGAYVCKADALAAGFHQAKS